MPAFRLWAIIAPIPIWRVKAPRSRLGKASAVSNRDFLSLLQAIVGEEDVISHPEDLLVYEYDGSIDTAIPELWSFPPAPRK